MIVGSSRQHSEILWTAGRIRILPAHGGVRSIFSPFSGQVKCCFPVFKEKG